MMAQMNDPVGDNSIELTMRIPGAMYETAGMVLLISGNAAQVSLRTRTGPDSGFTTRRPRWPWTAASRPPTTCCFMVRLRFVAEVRSSLTGQIAQLRADSPLPAGEPSAWWAGAHATALPSTS